ncbi:Vegetative incompatibility protein HET-E-1, partial [Fusarium culmorum]
MPLLLATKTQSSCLDDRDACDSFCSAADWLESRVLCMLGGLSLVNPARCVIAVADLSAKVFSLCLQYSREVKNAKDDIEKLREEVATFRATAKELQTLVQRPRGKELKASQQLTSAIEDGRSRLEELEKQLQPSTGRKRMSRFGIRALKWPFESNEVKGTIEDLERCRGTISLALNIDQTTILQNVDDRTTLNQLPVAHGASFDSKAEEHNPTCLPDTREELLKEIDRWIDDSKSKTIFWLNGMAGTGKSTISRTVARSHSERGDLCGSFFFKRGEMDRGNLNKLMPTLAHQLTLSIPGVAFFVKKTLDANPTIIGKTVKEQFEKLVLEPLSEAAATATASSPVVMVIDALDECDQEADIKLLINIFSQAKTLLPQLRVFLTSRPELPIRLGFSEVQGSYQDLVLHEIPGQIVEHDIIVFLDDEFEKIRHDFNMTVCDERKLPSDWPGHPIIQSLAQMAVPLFIFAATVCRFVGDSRRRNPRARLQTVLDQGRRSHGSQLEQTYTPVLRSQIVDLPKEEREEVIEDFKVVIGSIVTLANPLSVAALSRLIDILPDTADERLDALHSVLSIPLERTMPVRLLHLSFRDYLVDSKNKERIEFWVDTKLAHRRLAENCLRVMRSGLRKNICSLSFPGMQRPAVSNRQLEERVPPELQYACMYWVHHQTKVDLQPNDVDDMYDFLETHFLHWLEALSLIGRISESIGFIEELLSIVDVEKGGQVVSFLHDAKRFVFSCRWVVDTAPLQLYASAIVFAPKQSIVRQTFKRYLPRWIALLPKVDSEWNAVLQTLEGHTSSVNSVVFSKDGKLIASGSDDDTIKIWNVATGKEEQTLEGHTDSVLSVVFSKDDRLIASGSKDKTIKIWNVTTGEEEQTLEGHTDWVWSMVFSNDGKLIASGSWDKTIKIWNITTGKEEQTLEGHTDSVLSVVFSKDDRLIASGSKDKTIKIWNVTTGEEEQTLEGHTGSVLSVVFSKDGTLIASGSGDNTIKIWDVTTGEEEQTLEGHTNRVLSVVFSKDGKLIASGSGDNTIKIWDVTTGEEEQTLEGHTNSVWSMVFSNDGKLIASESWDNTIKIWNVAMGEEEQTLEGHTGSVLSVVFSKDGTLIASGSDDKTIKIWNITTGEEEQTLEGHTDSVLSVVFSKDDRLIASGSKDKTIKIWNVTMGEEEQTLEGHTDWVRSVVFSKDSALIASGSYMERCEGEEEQTLEGHTDWVISVVFSKDGTLIASGSYDSTIKIWNVATGVNVNSFNASLATDVLSFIDHDSILVTSLGRFSVESRDASTTQPSEREAKLDSLEVQGEVDGGLSFGINHDRTWITAGGPDGWKVLWLPPGFRPAVSATSTEPRGSVVAIGCPSGRVVVIGFRQSSFLDGVEVL